MSELGGDNFVSGIPECGTLHELLHSLHESVDFLAVTSIVQEVKVDSHMKLAGSLWNDAVPSSDGVVLNDEWLPDKYDHLFPFAWKSSAAKSKGAHFK